MVLIGFWGSPILGKKKDHHIPSARPPLPQWQKLPTGLLANGKATAGWKTTAWRSGNCFKEESLKRHQTWKPNMELSETHGKPIEKHQIPWFILSFRFNLILYHFVPHFQANPSVDEDVWWCPASLLPVRWNYEWSDLTSLKHIIIPALALDLY